MPLTFRKGTSQDLPEICVLISEAIAEMQKNQIDQWDELYPTAEDFETDIKNRQLIVGEINGMIAIVYAVNSECDEQYLNGHWTGSDMSFRVIHRLCVKPAFQKRGFASAALENIERDLKAADVVSIRLDVFSENPYALRLYGRFGYKTVGHVRWRKGRFVLMEKLLY